MANPNANSDSNANPNKNSNKKPAPGKNTITRKVLFLVEKKISEPEIREKIKELVVKAWLSKDFAEIRRIEWLVLNKFDGESSRNFFDRIEIADYREKSDAAVINYFQGTLLKNNIYEIAIKNTENIAPQNQTSILIGQDNARNLFSFLSDLTGEPKHYSKYKTFNEKNQAGNAKKEDEFNKSLEQRLDMEIEKYIGPQDHLMRDIGEYINKISEKVISKIKQGAVEDYVMQAKARFEKQKNEFFENLENLLGNSEYKKIFSYYNNEKYRANFMNTLKKRAEEGSLPGKIIEIVKKLSVNSETPAEEELKILAEYYNATTFMSLEDTFAGGLKKDINYFLKKNQLTEEQKLFYKILIEESSKGITRAQAFSFLYVIPDIISKREEINKNSLEIILQIYEKIKEEYKAEKEISQKARSVRKEIEYSETEQRNNYREVLYRTKPISEGIELAKKLREIKSDIELVADSKKTFEKYAEHLIETPDKSKTISEIISYFESTMFPNQKDIKDITKFKKLVDKNGINESIIQKYNELKGKVILGRNLENIINERFLVSKDSTSIMDKQLAVLLPVKYPVEKYYQNLQDSSKIGDKMAEKIRKIISFSNVEGEYFRKFSDFSPSKALESVASGEEGFITVAGNEFFEKTYASIGYFKDWKINRQRIFRVKEQIKDADSIFSNNNSRCFYQIDYNSKTKDLIDAISKSDFSLQEKKIIQTNFSDYFQFRASQFYLGEIIRVESKIVSEMKSYEEKNRGKKLFSKNPFSGIVNIFIPEKKRK